jgi:sugar lactone lactonase YvrE
MNTNAWRGTASVGALLVTCAASWQGTAQAAAPTFQSQPTNVTVIPGQDARFEAEATDVDPYLSSKWQVSTDGGLTWRDIQGGPYSSRLVVPAVTMADNGKRYRRVLSYPPDVANTRAALLTVVPTTESRRRLDLLAGALGGLGSPVDNLVGTTQRFNHPEWLSADAQGNVYLPQEGHVFIKIDTARKSRVMVGDWSRGGHVDGKGSDARLGAISGSVVAPNGDIFVVQAWNHTIRKITPAGTVTTIAGSRSPGHADGKGQAASFDTPTGIARDSVGNLYVADTGNHTIRKITPTGVVSTWAGKAGVPGSGGTTVDDARFNRPQGVAIGPGDLLYVTDTDNHAVRRISPQGFVAKIAGEYGVTGHSDGVGGMAHFRGPTGIAVNQQGEIYVADSGNNTIRRIIGTSVTTLAGMAGTWGDWKDGTGGEARFFGPTGLALQANGNLLVGDTFNDAIRRVSPDGVVISWAGKGRNIGSADGTGAEARFHTPWGLTVDAAGNIYVADWGGPIRKVTPAGVVSSFSMGSGGAWQLAAGVAVDAQGNMWVADSGSCVIRHITPDNVSTIVAGEPDDCRYQNGNGRNARFGAMRGIVIDAHGNLYVAEGRVIRKITPSLDVSRYAGSNADEPARDGTLNTARFRGASALVFDNAGNLFVGDDQAIRKITPAGTVTTLAGSLTVYGKFADGTGDKARFLGISGIAVDLSGNLYASDSRAHAIRKITPSGVVTTVAGTPEMATVLIGRNPLLNYPLGMVMLDNNRVAVTSEGAVLIFTVP